MADPTPPPTDEGEVSAPSTSVRYTVNSSDRSSRGHLDTASAKAAVVISTEQLRDLSNEQRSSAAGLAGLPLAALDGLIAADLPLVLETQRQPAVARIRAQQLAKRHQLPVQASTGGSVGRLVATTGLGLTGVGVLLGTLMFGALGVTFLAMFGATLFTVIMAVAVWIMKGWNDERVLLANSLEAEGEAREERNRRAEDSVLGTAWAALTATRQALAAADLPATAAGDLRDVLGAAEEELEDLSKAKSVLHRGAGANDELPEIRAAAAELEAVLAQLGVAVAAWQAMPEESSMDGLIDATTRLRARRLRA